MPVENIVTNNDLLIAKPLFPPWLYSFRTQAVIIAALAILFYCNTFGNESASDDVLVILRNEYVLEGVTGINNILTKDSYDSYYRQRNAVNPLSGGRYRPLSIITFAIEQQFLGAIPPGETDSVARVAPSFENISPYDKKLSHDMHVRHLVNVVLFALSMLILLYFLHYIVFPANSMLAFLAVLLFVIHPIHTEVVANVKSRDEILSLLFISLTFILAFKYRRSQKKWALWAALGAYFLAFLSKEYAITLLVLLPLSFYLFNNDPIKRCLLATVPYLAIAIVYIVIRLLVSYPLTDIVDNSIRNNAYAYATGSEATATKVATSLNYFRLLLFPHPLSSDYSYHSIPYKDFSHPLVWLSVLFHLLIVAGIIYFTKKRHPLAFALAFYLLNLLLVNNWLFNIGTTMGERLIYHASVGFAIVAAYLLYYGAGKIKPTALRLSVVSAFMLVILTLSAFKTIQRNTQWKNNFILSLNDLKVMPDSYFLNENMAIMYNNRSGHESTERDSIEDLHKAIGYINKLIQIDNRNEIGYVYKYLAYFKLKQSDSLISNLDKVRAINSSYPELWKMYFDAGVLFYKSARYREALNAWQTALQIKPDYANAQNAINILYSYGLVKK